MWSWAQEGGLTNSALQFERILVINLPRRTDRKDAMTLIAASTGLKLNWVDGLLGSEVSA
jgi:hypothetical protein